MLRSWRCSLLCSRLASLAAFAGTPFASGCDELVAAAAELSLAKWAGTTPHEVLGRVPFRNVTEEPYTITLPPYGFLWFDLVDEDRRSTE